MVFPRDLMTNDYEKGFFLYKGERLGSLSDLMRSLDNMSEHQFNFHTNKERNDFANWIRDVLGDPFLARRVKMAKNIKALKKVLFCYIYR